MLEATFLYTAIAGGALLALQLLMMFLGGHDGGHDVGLGHDQGDGFASHDADGSTDGGGHHSAGSFILEMLSIRTLAAAAMFFGLVGLTALSYNASAQTALLLAGGAAMAALYSVFWMFQQLFKLESSGSQNILNAIGLPATVYLRIPAKDQGRGKVQLKMQFRIVEYAAVTDETEAIPTGENVWVTDIVNGETLRVAREEFLAPES